MKTIVEMTREAGGFDATPEFLERFAALVRADERSVEREACAKECDELAGILACHNDKDGSDICVSLRDTIRARGNT